MGPWKRKKEQGLKRFVVRRIGIGGEIWDD
jgi:hypothetical protein